MAYRARNTGENLTDYLKAKQAYEIQTTGSSGVDFGSPQNIGPVASGTEYANMLASKNIPVQSIQPTQPTLESIAEGVKQAQATFAAMQERIARTGVTSDTGQVLAQPGAYNPATNQFSNLVTNNQPPMATPALPQVPSQVLPPTPTPTPSPTPLQTPLQTPSQTSVPNQDIYEALREKAGISTQEAEVKTAKEELARRTKLVQNVETQLEELERNISARLQGTMATTPYASRQLAIESKPLQEQYARMVKGETEARAGVELEQGDVTSARQQLSDMINMSQYQSPEQKLQATLAEQEGKLKLEQQYATPEIAKPSYTEVSPGNTVIDPTTGKVIYQAPAKPETPKVGATIGLSDITNYGLPVSLLGQPESILASATPPAWFRQQEEAKARMSLTSQELQRRWDEFRAIKKANSASTNSSGITNPFE